MSGASARKSGAPRAVRRAGSVWKMQDAKAQFSLVAKRAQEEGPQRVTNRGKDAVVVLSAAEYDNLIGNKAEKEPSLLEFFQNSPLRDLDFEVPRVPMRFRDPEF